MPPSWWMKRTPEELLLDYAVAYEAHAAGITTWPMPVVVREPKK